MSRAAWVDVLAAMAVGVGELAAAIGMHVWFEDLPYDERPVPWLARVPFVLAGCAGFAWVFSCVRVWQRRREAAKRGAAVAALVGQFVLTIAGAGGVLVSDPDFLFGSTLEDSIDLPDGRRAHLYRGGLFCSYDVFIATREDLFSFRTMSISRNDCEAPAKLQVEGVRVVVVDEHGQPLSSNGADFAVLFDWAPH
jgi:hypothetical protein